MIHIEDTASNVGNVQVRVWQSDELASQKVYGCIMRCIKPKTGSSQCFHCTSSEEARYSPSLEGGSAREEALLVLSALADLKKKFEPQLLVLSPEFCLTEMQRLQLCSASRVRFPVFCILIWILIAKNIC